MSDTLLRTEALSKSFGGVSAVSNVDLEIAGGTIHAIIGPNGSGKSTFINLLSGVYRPTSGKIILLGSAVEGLTPHQITRRGMSRTFQNLRLFLDLTVLENVMVGLSWNSGTGIAGTVLRTRSHLVREARDREMARRICASMGIGELADARASELAYGLQRRVEIARALAGDPRLLLLDEPVAGMNSQEIRELSGQLTAVRDQGTTILLIEHNMRFVMQLCDRVSVFDHGVKIFEGSPGEVQRSERVIDSYLGTPPDAARA
jgi:ABC-type branched-subunit amino acid transport system ATPase component